MNVKYIFDGTVGEFNMDLLPISLQLMDPNCKPIHERAYTFPRSVEQQYLFDGSLGEFNMECSIN
jgi:hypothetical protein